MTRFIAALLGILSWGCVAFFSIRFPLADSLGPGPFDQSWIWGWSIVAAAVLSWLPWMAPRAGETRPRWRFSRVGWILVSLVLQISFCLLASTFLHRDFMTLVFQAIAIHYALFLDAAPREANALWRRFPAQLFVFSLVVVGFFLVWIALMGYAIASRAEPRWIPSIAYNVINLGICFFIAIANVNLRSGARRDVFVEDSGVFVNDLDILPLVGHQSRRIAVRLLARTDEPLACREACALACAPPCPPDCAAEGGCAGLAAATRRVLEAGKVFSALKLGSVAPRSGARGSAETRWIFVPDPSVRVVVKPGVR